MDQQRHPRVGQEVVCFPRCGVGGHDDGGVGVERGRGKIGVRHQGDVWCLVITCCQMQLWERLVWLVGGWGGTDEAGVLETLDDLGWE